MGTTLAVFRQSGNLPVESEIFIKRVRMGEIMVAICLKALFEKGQQSHKNGLETVENCQMQPLHQIFCIGG